MVGATLLPDSYVAHSKSLSDLGTEINNLFLSCHTEAVVVVINQNFVSSLTPTQVQSGIRAVQFYLSRYVQTTVVWINELSLDDCKLDEGACNAIQRQWNQDQVKAHLVFSNNQHITATAIRNLLLVSKGTQPSL